MLNLFPFFLRGPPAVTVLFHASPDSSLQADNNCWLFNQPGISPVQNNLGLVCPHEKKHCAQNILSSIRNRRTASQKYFNTTLNRICQYNESQQHRIQKQKKMVSYQKNCSQHLKLLFNKCKQNVASKFRLILTKDFNCLNSDLRK